MITSSENKQMKQIIQLNAKAKVRKKTGLFVVEGIKMFLEAPIEQIERVFVSESFLNSPQGQTVLAQKGEAYCREGDVLEVVSDKVFASVCDTLTPQGILSIIKMAQWKLEDLFPKDGRVPLILVLDSLQDPGNLGTMIRTGEGAGITGVIMNQTCVDVTNPKTIRATMGSIYRIPQIITEDLSILIQELKGRGVKTYAAHLKGQRDFYREDYTSPVAFLIGNEGNGLSDEVAQCADCYVKIPMEGQVESLNAAIAASVMLYECKRQRSL